jgi:fructosamine-3-kinase
MAWVFGGFDEEFYDTYNQKFPLCQGWETRVELFQLYPLLVHLNLFGIAYRDSVIGNMKKYC